MIRCSRGRRTTTARWPPSRSITTNGRTARLFTFTPFGRVDSADSERTHWDIRELYYLYPQGLVVLPLRPRPGLLGGDRVRPPRGRRSTRPILSSTSTARTSSASPCSSSPSSEGWGTLDIFILPYFRERTFPGREGRLRPELVIDTDDAVYESSSEQSAKDLAIRYSRTFGDVDVGAYLFCGNQPRPAAGPVGPSWIRTTPASSG